MAQQELSAFFHVVRELYGPDQAQASADDWLRRLNVNKCVPASPREWRALTIAAAVQLAGRVSESYQEEAE